MIQQLLTEHQHQSLLMQWAQASVGCWSELEWLHAIPNGAKLPFAKDNWG